jgi:hypothetical protein
LGLPATVYVTTWYSNNQLPVINVAIAYILRCAGISSANPLAITTEIEQLRSLSERAEALRDFAARFGMTTEEWWHGRQFHIMSAAEVKEADRRGLDIQLHTHRHRSSEVHSDYLEQEIADNRAALAEACGKPENSFRHFCYPSGIVHVSAPGILKAVGVRSATLVNEGINPPRTSPYRLHRFLDGRSVTPAAFEAYLSGARELYRTAKSLAIAEG